MGLEAQGAARECWGSSERENSKSLPYVKEILKPRQHFLSFFLLIIKIGKRKGGGLESLGYFSFAFPNNKPGGMALIRESHSAGEHTSLHNERAEFAFTFSCD